MLQNAYFLAKIGADPAENEQHFAEVLPKTANYPTGWSDAPGVWGRAFEARLPRLRVALAQHGPHGGLAGFFFGLLRCDFVSEL